MKAYKPTGCENKLAKKYELSEGAYGNVQIGVVECVDGYRIYVMKDNEEQAEMGLDILEEAIEKIKEIATATQSQLSEV